MSVCVYKTNINYIDYNIFNIDYRRVSLSKGLYRSIHCTEAISNLCGCLHTHVMGPMSYTVYTLSKLMHRHFR